jgi:hypothetical protein
MRSQATGIFIIAATVAVASIARTWWGLMFIWLIFGFTWPSAGGSEVLVRCCAVSAPNGRATKVSGSVS